MWYQTDFSAMGLTIFELWVMEITHPNNLKNVWLAGSKDLKIDD